VTSFAIELGLVPTLARPGGNLSGVTIFSEELNVKRLALLRELLPEARRLGALRDPAAAPDEHLRSIRQAAQELRVSARPCSCPPCVGPLRDANWSPALWRIPLSRRSATTPRPAKHARRIRLRTPLATAPRTALAQGVC
jgi:hypothetical protein